MITAPFFMSSANWITRPKVVNEDETIESPLVSSALAGNSNSSRDKDTKDSNNNSATTNNEANGRSAALERAYVHDVYENCEEPVGAIRPRVAQFLANLDAGSIVCDVGCGNGRYLTAGCNPSIYSIGVDRCYRLSKIASTSGAEVAICDNLELPFRDESFDAVLSLAVVHHFATTERRVSAIRELARVLRIGGKLIISVWALEQKSRRFESQDVLIPWQSPKSKNTATSDDEDDDDFLPPYHAYTYTEDSTHSNSSRGDGDSSSLSSSSPSDTCYSFVRRALQKLAGGKKSPWFLDSWNSKDTKNDSSLDYEDAKDLPIELRRLEDFDDIPEPLSSVGLKSRSLGSILNPPPKQIVRSRSSVPSLGAEMKQSQMLEPLTHNSVTNSVLTTSAHTNASSVTSSAASRRPKLIKQKQSISDDPEFPFDENSPYTKHIAQHNDMRAQLLRKQSSLNEELMAESRIREKERIRKKIQKQMSLNETFLCRSLFTKRLQVIREGFTTKLKTSTGSLERVTKSGIVKIMQNIKSAGNTGQSTTENTTTARINELKTTKNGSLCRKLSNNNSYERQCSAVSGEDMEKIRRYSRESGSDSSKDSSLQSDTSIESEDSFASVIYIPKKSDTLSNKMPSVPIPTSPLIMPCPTPIHSPAPATSSQRQMSSAKETTRFSFDTQQIEKCEKAQAPNIINNPEQESNGVKKLSTTIKMTGSGTQTQKISTIITPPTPTTKQINNPPSVSTTAAAAVASKTMTKITRETIKDLPPIPKFRKLSSFPIVRRMPSSNSNIAVPKLQSLELFNPETDDLDSDSSDEPSSPDSIDSVINALQSHSPMEPLLSNEECASTTSRANEDIISTSTKNNITEDTVEMVIHEQEDTTLFSNDVTKKIIINANDINLNVKLTSHHQNSNNNYNNTSNLKNTFNNNNNNNIHLNNDNSKLIHSDNSSDNVEKCREHLVEFAEQLSAQLLKELDNETTGNGEHKEDFDFDPEKSDDDPYLRKINGEIRNLNLLRDELRERRLMLANLTSKSSSHLSHDMECNQQPSYSNTPPTTIQELEEDDSPPLSAKIQSHLSQNPNLISNLGTPQAAKKQQQKINDFIPEENEENDDVDEDSSSRSRISFSMSYNACNNNCSSTHDTALLLQEDSFEENDNSSSMGLQQMKQNLLKTIKHPMKLSDSNNNSNTNSCDSWANSNSTTASLDSPSVGGGSATHHRYYHVFREGELDALINKHVSNLHIVSSYYERASWCVVCEKVQVWTI